MPKGKKGGGGSAKGTPKRVPRNKRGGGYSDEDSVETSSVVSSDRGSYFDDGDNGNDVESGDSASVVFGDTMDDKLAEAIDRLSEKSAGARISALASLISFFTSTYNPDGLIGRRRTLRDYLEKILKRGSTSEQALAAHVYTLATLQLVGIENDGVCEDFGVMKPVLLSIVADHTASMEVRAKCCEAVCIGALFGETSRMDVGSLIAALEPLFANWKEIKPVVTGDAFGIGAVAAPVTPSKTKSSILATAAVSGWALLLTVMSREFMSQKVNRWIPTLTRLLEQSDLDLRLSVGEAITVVVEKTGLSEGSDSDATLSSDEESAEDEDMIELLTDKLRELATESHKYRGKKDKRQQHHSFRDFLRAVEDGDGPEFQMKFGLGEILEIDSWAKKRQYDAIVKVLGSGINKHLIDNMGVRDLLSLGAPLPSIAENPHFDAKQAKSERQYLNAMNFKVRSVNRGKNRDHRMASLADY